MCFAVSLHQFALHPVPDDLGSTLQRLDGDIATVWIDHPVHLRATGVHHYDLASFAGLAFAHCLGKLPCDDLLEYLGLKLDTHTSFFQETVQHQFIMTIFSHFRPPSCATTPSSNPQGRSLRLPDKAVQLVDLVILEKIQHHCDRLVWKTL
jgi:hypothetical protein